MDEDIVGGASSESYDVIGVVFLTMEHPQHNKPTAFKKSTHLFMVANNACYTLLQCSLFFRQAHFCKKDWALFNKNRDNR